jgi:antitoxin CptB
MMRADQSGALPQAGAEALRRLRWRARRGLLENDLLIGRFLEQQADALNAAEVDALARLLDLSDAELLELLLGRRQPAGELDLPAVRDLLIRLGSRSHLQDGSTPEPLTSPRTSGARRWP